MKQLRYLQDATVCKLSFEKNEIGELIETENELDTYKCYVMDSSNDVQSNDYGATIKNKRRISSVRNELEAFFDELVNYTDENVSNYRVRVGTKRYVVLSVKPTYIDTELSDV